MTGEAFGFLNLKVVDGVVTEIPRAEDKFQGRVINPATIFMVTILKKTRSFSSGTHVLQM